MGFEVKVTGTADLYKVRQALRQVGDTGLGKEMDRAFKDATKPLETEIRASAGSHMPSGYGPVLSRSLSFRLASRTARQSTELRLRVFAQGKKDRRDIPALNQGRLRHPVYGRRKSPWVVQRVKAGFADKPFSHVGPKVQREMRAVLDDVAAKLKG